MSITNFQDAISSQVNHYDDTVKTLRDNEIGLRNTALAGIQSEVEKWGEVAKLGLEFPVAIEGLKAVGKTAKAGFGYLTKGKEALGNIKSALEGGPEGLAARARGALGTAMSKGGGGSSFEDLQSRFDNLRSDVGSAGESKGNSILEMSKMKITAPKLTSGTPGETGIEMQATDDLTNSNSLLPADTYGRDQPSIDLKTAPDQPSTKVPLGEDGATVAPQSSPGDPMVYSEDTSRPTPRQNPISEDASPPERIAPTDMEMIDRGATRGPTAGNYASLDDATGGPARFAPPQQPRQVGGESKSNFSQRPDNWQNPETGGTKGAGEIRPGTETGGQPGELSDLANESKEQDSLRRLAGQRGPTDGNYANLDEASGGPGRYAPPTLAGDEPDIPPTADNAGTNAAGIGDDLLEGGGETAAAVTEEGLGAGLLASGIFAPLGALLEGLGAITEVASVGAGAYGAVKSMIDTGQEDALRAKPLPPINPGNLDVGGAIAAPELA